MNIEQADGEVIWVEPVQLPFWVDKEECLIYTT